MLTLLEVLPGWPEAEPASPLYLFLLMIGAPLFTGLIITVLAFAPEKARQARESRSAGNEDISL